MRGPCSAWLVDTPAPPAFRQRRAGSDSPAAAPAFKIDWIPPPIPFAALPISAGRFPVWIEKPKSVSLTRGRVYITIDPDSIRRRDFH